MSDRVIEYAPGPLTPVHSRAGVVGFACAALAAGGIVVTMFLIARPIPGPVGGRTRELAPLFGTGVLLLWVAGATLGTVGLRQHHSIRTFAWAALATCAATVALFVLMTALMY